MKKIDKEMLALADRIYAGRGDDDICTIPLSKLVDGFSNYSLHYRLQERGYIEIIKEGRKFVFRWLHGMLRPYQVWTTQRIEQSKSRRILVSLSTGSGKTYTALNLIQRYKTSLFVTPRINLSHQTREVFGREIDSIGILQGSNSRNIDADHIVANLQTLEIRIRQHKFNTDKFDLVIFDEAHYSSKRILDIFSHFPNAKIVGLTATPYTSNGTPLDGYDETVEDFNTQYFIDKGYLSSLHAMQTVTVDDSKLKNSANGDYTQSSIDEVTLDDVLNSNIVSVTSRYIAGNKKVMVFAASIKHCNLLASGYREAGFSVVVLHSQIEEDANEVLRRFKEDDTQIIVSVAMINFGTDIPAVDVGVIARPMRSKSMWVQTCGRLLRTAPGKNRAILLDCAGNLKRLGNPLAKVKPPVKKEEITDPFCKLCGYKKAPYLKSTEIVEFQRINTYRCTVCSEEYEVVSDLETIPCPECNTYHLENEAVIEGSREVIHCNCGETLIVRELMTFKMALADDGYDEKHIILNNKLTSFLSANVDDLAFGEMLNMAMRVQSFVSNDERKLDEVIEMLDKSGNDICGITSRIDPGTPLYHTIKEVGGSDDLYWKVEGRIKQSEVSRHTMEKAVTTRLHNLHSADKDISSVLGFIPWFEKQQSITQAGGYR